MLATECRVADSFLSRGIGLLLSAPLRDGEGLLITRTSTITMAFMRFPIDAVFVDGDRRVVSAVPRIAPWRPAIHGRGGREVLELPVGAIEASGTQAGDELLYE